MGHRLRCADAARKTLTAPDPCAYAHASTRLHAYGSFPAAFEGRRRSGMTAWARCFDLDQKAQNLGPDPNLDPYPLASWHGRRHA